MRLKNKFLLFSLLFSFSSWGLVEIPRGVLKVQGKILWHENQAFLLVNSGTLSQTKLKLAGDLTSLKGQNGSNAELKIEVEKKILSSVGEANFLKVEKMLHPNEVPKQYIEMKSFIE